MRVAVCKISEFVDWIEQNAELPKAQQSRFVFSEGYFAEIAPNSNGVIFRFNGRGPCIVKLLKGSTHDGYDIYGRVSDNTRPAFRRADMTMYRIVDRAIKQRSAFWLVIDEN